MNWNADVQVKTVSFWVVKKNYQIFSYSNIYIPTKPTSKQNFLLRSFCFNLWFYQENIKRHLLQLLELGAIFNMLKIDVLCSILSWFSCTLLRFENFLQTKNTVLMSKRNVEERTRDYWFCWGTSLEQTEVNLVNLTNTRAYIANVKKFRLIANSYKNKLCWLNSVWWTAKNILSIYYGILSAFEIH